MEVPERAYWNKEVARILNIADSTVRKWSITLEQHGYAFHKGNKDSRAFTQHDIDALMYFKELTKNGSYSLEQAAKLVVERFGERRDASVSASVTPGSRSDERHTGVTSEQFQELLEINKKQLEMNEILIRRISEQTEIIKKQFESIDTLQNMIVSNEEQKLLEVKDFEQGKDEKKKINNVFSKFFGKRQ